MDCKMHFAPEPQISKTERSEIISITAVCRLCAGQSERFIGIFSEEGITNDLSNKINLYLPIKVSLNDSMPLQCCLNCASTILAWHELVVTSVEADRKFQNCHFINQKQIKGDEDFENVGPGSVTSDENDSFRSSDDTETKEPEDKRIEKPGIGDFQCNTCNKPFRTRIGLKRHIKWCKESPGSCTICNKTFARDWDLKRHKKSCTIVPEETNKIFDKIANLITKTCTKCDLKFENSTKLKQHVKDKHNIIYKRKRRKGDEIIAQFFCDICKKGYTRKFDMEKHRSKAHSGLPPLKNNGELTRRKENMILIKQSKFKDLEGKIYYKCDFCEKHFTQSYNLMRHRTIHTGVRSYFCHICGKSFRISNGLTRHIDNYHKGLKRFSCDVCGKKFAARATRDEHMNIHNNYRPFICDKCGKCFKQKATLNIHKMFHTDQFKFLCSTCGKKFRRAQELKVHTWLHTGHKPYACKECPAVFRLGQELKRHLKVHERVGECVCGDCGSVFTQERYLKIHRKIHVNNRAVNIEIVPVK